MSDLGLRCQKPDALGRLSHKHCRDPTHFPSHMHLGVQFFSCLWEYGLRGAESTSRSNAIFAAASSAPPTSPPEPIALPTDVQTGESLSAEDRAKLDHEVSEFSKRMESWKSKADAKDWDQVKADLEVYVLAGEKVTEDPRRTAEYKAKVVEGLRLEDTSHRPGLAAIKEAVSRKAAGFWVGEEVCARLCSDTSSGLLSRIASGVKQPSGLMTGLRKSASGVS